MFNNYGHLCLCVLCVVCVNIRLRSCFFPCHKTHATSPGEKLDVDVTLDANLDLSSYEVGFLGFLASFGASCWLMIFFPVKTHKKNRIPSLGLCVDMK